MFPIQKDGSWEKRRQEVIASHLANKIESAKAEYARPKIESELLKEKLANHISAAKIPYIDQMEQAELAYKQAQGKRENAMANLPFGGQSLAGDAGQIMAIEAIGMKFGKDSPQYKSAQQAFELEQRGAESRINYQNKYADTLDTRMLSPFGKLMKEMEMRKNGQTPGINNDAWQAEYNKQPPIQGKVLPMSLEQINKMRGMEGQPPISEEEYKQRMSQQSAPGAVPSDSQLYSAANQEIATETKNLGRDLSKQEQDAIINQYQQEIYKTRPTEAMKNQAHAFGQFFNELSVTKKEYLPSMKHFAGLSGKLDYNKEKAKAALGIEPSEEYRKYDAFKGRLSYMAMDSLRKAQQTSVIPGYVQQTIGPLTDPTSDIWADPTQVQKRFDSFYKWAEDLNNYNLNVSNKGSPRTIEEQKSYSLPPESASKENKPSLQSSSDKVGVQDEQGNIFYGTPEQVNAFLKDHPDHKRIG